MVDCCKVILTLYICLLVKCLILRWLKRKVFNQSLGLKVGNNYIIYFVIICIFVMKVVLFNLNKSNKII